MRSPCFHINLKTKIISKRYWKVKYLIEWLISFFAIIILSPIFLLIVILEKCQDGGPIFYISRRIGKGGKEFKFYKFRGMVIDAKPIISNELKYITVENDPRITHLGKILRLGFDELPQLFNIIKGDMCLIGPRPFPPWEFHSKGIQYDEREIKRLNVLPGITGLTQLLDGRSLHYRDNYELDVRYVENSTLKTDILIFLFTIPYSFGFKKFYRNLFKKYLENIPCQKAIDEMSANQNQ